MKNEKGLQNWIIGQCRESGILCEKIESKSARGWPDLVLMYGGRVVWIEVKSPTGKGRLSDAQMRCHAKMWDVGGWVYTVGTVELATAIIRNLMNGDLI